MRLRVYLLMYVTTSTFRPMADSACRATGAMDQPTSCPWVLAIARTIPARRKVGVSRARGAAAPNHTAVSRCSGISAAARCATEGTGNINDPG